MPRIKITNSTPSIFDYLDKIEAAPAQEPQKLCFISFGSGSSGNCEYIGDKNQGILIDAGVKPENVTPVLKRYGISMSAVKAILLTHDHADHVRYTYKLVKKHPHIAVVCTPKCLSGIFLRHSLSPRLKDYHKPIFIETPIKVGNFQITAFTTMHDGRDNVGYFIQAAGINFAVATDLGCISDRVDYYLRQANYIMLESNYDDYMLTHGKYPLHLQARIMADNGHLDNKVAAAYIAKIYTKKLSHVFLCHLSHDNNTPEKALEEMKTALDAAGITMGDASESLESRDADLQIFALPRFDPSPLFALNPIPIE